VLPHSGKVCALMYTYENLMLIQSHMTLINDILESIYATVYQGLLCHSHKMILLECAEIVRQHNYQNNL